MLHPLEKFKKRKGVLLIAGGDITERNRFEYGWEIDEPREFALIKQNLFHHYRRQCYSQTSTWDLIVNTLSEDQLASLY